MKKIKSNKSMSAEEKRISVCKTVFESAVGRNLVEATQNLLADQGCFFDEIERFEILSARRISTTFRVYFTGHEGELWEVWEFEFFAHPDKLESRKL